MATATDPSLATSRPHSTTWPRRMSAHTRTAERSTTSWGSKMRSAVSAEDEPGRGRWGSGSPAPTTSPSTRPCPGTHRPSASTARTRPGPASAPSAARPGGPRLSSSRESCSWATRSGSAGGGPLRVPLPASRTRLRCWTPNARTEGPACRQKSARGWGGPPNPAGVRTGLGGGTPSAAALAGAELRALSPGAPEIRTPEATELDLATWCRRDAGA
mmetsp:Transcript_49403/g.147542  ORF Transcript_49403/g.147542 Transcript_49403/m.147542 type:complete len:216 (+) Transcript_49403:764-1411(+)